MLTNSLHKWQLYVKEIWNKTAAGLKPTTTQFVNEHSTDQSNFSEQCIMKLSPAYI